LEREWGTFKYNIYILLSYILTIAVAFILPDIPLSNFYIFLSIFLAFAYLYPDFQLLLFFILPVKVKWLALIQWITYAIMLLFGTWSMRLLIIASVCNFLLFFGKDIVTRGRYSIRRERYKPKKTQSEDKPFHTCSECGLTDIQDPNMGFRYCAKCDHRCFCMDHLDTHECTS